MFLFSLTFISAQGFKLDNTAYLNKNNIGTFNTSGDICITGGNCLSNVSGGEVDLSNYYTKTDILDFNYFNASNEADLNVNSSLYSNETNWWAGLKDWVSGWFIKTDDELNFNETKLNETISIQGLILGFNSTYNSTYDALTPSPWITSGSNIHYDNGFVGVNVSDIRASLHINTNTNFGVIIERGTTVPAGTYSGSNKGNSRFIMAVDGSRSPSIELHRGISGYSQAVAMYMDWAWADNSDRDMRIIMNSNDNLRFEGPANLAYMGTGGFGIGTVAPGTNKLKVVGNANVTGTVYYGALQANSPHAFLGDGEVNYTRICVQATDGTVLMQVFEKNNITGKYETLYKENQRECFKQLIDESHTYEDYELVEGEPQLVKTTITTYKEAFTNKELNPTVEKFYEDLIEWMPNYVYDEGQVLEYNGEAYEVLQDHTSLSNWKPDEVASLYSKKTIVEAGGELTEVWVQPTGIHDAYNIGDRVIYNEKVYESLINGNVWSPDAYPSAWKEKIGFWEWLFG